MSELSHLTDEYLMTLIVISALMAIAWIAAMTYYIRTNILKPVVPGGYAVTIGRKVQPAPAHGRMDFQIPAHRAR